MIIIIKLCLFNNFIVIFVEQTSQSKMLIKQNYIFSLYFEKYASITKNHLFLYYYISNIIVLKYELKYFTNTIIDANIVHFNRLINFRKSFASIEYINVHDF